MKSDRQRAILEVISSRNIETQEELSEILRKMGFKVTQATISRDIKELHLIKVQIENGVYKYAVNESSTVLYTERMIRVFRHFLSALCIQIKLTQVSTPNRKSRKARKNCSRKSRLAQRLF